MPESLRWCFRLCLAVVVAAILGYLPYQAYGPSGIGQVLRMERHLDRLASRNERMARSNAELQLQIDRLRRSDHELERVARDELGLVRQDDIVFQFERPSGASAGGHE